MFMGEFKHNLDAKGRLTLPSKFREDLGDSVVVNRGFEGCLNVYPMSEWEKIYSKLITLPTNKKETRKFVRLFTAKAQEVEFDKLGRINIPKGLIDEAELVKECMVVGVANHVEIWDAQAWQDYYDSEKDSLENISENLEDFGF